MKIIKILILTMSSLFALTPWVYLVDWQVFHSKYSSKLYFGSSCQYAVPDDYKILSNGTDFIVQYKDNKVLADGYGIDAYYDANEAIHFMDTCNAKAAIKEHYEILHPLTISKTGYK